MQKYILIQILFYSLYFLSQLHLPQSSFLPPLLNLQFSVLCIMFQKKKWSIILIFKKKILNFFHFVHTFCSVLFSFAQPSDFFSFLHWSFSSFSSLWGISYFYVLFFFSLYFYVLLPLYSNFIRIVLFSLSLSSMFSSSSIHVSPLLFRFIFAQ